MEKRIKRKIGALAILGMLAVIALSTSVIADLDNYIWYRDDVNNDVTLSSNATGYKVGIGRSDPVRKLDVLDTSNPQLRLSVSDTYFSDLQTTSSGYLYINPSHGRVGIGVNDPAETLEIDGNILLNTGADRSISVEQLLANNDGYKLTISSGDAYYLSGALGYTGGDLVLHAGDGAGPGGETRADGGNVYIYGGDPAGYYEGNVILAHTGTSSRGKVGIGTDSPAETLDVAGGVRVNYWVKSAYDQLWLLNKWNDGIYIDGGARVGLGTHEPLTLLELERAGTIKINTDFLTITNEVCAEDNDGTETSIRFRHWYWNFQTAMPGGEADSGRITIGTENDWYHLGDRDSYMAFQTSLDGTVDEKVRITSEGRVGIGTIYPDKLLHIGASGGTSGSMRFEASDGDVVDLGITTNNQFYITGGNVGIGIVTPSSELHIGGTTPQVTIGDAGEEDTSILFDGNAQDFYFALDDSTDDLAIGTGSTIGSNVKMVIENGGNVGIGTASPDTELHVNGDIKQKVTTSNVLIPPSDAQLDTLFGFPASNGDGWTAYLKDSDSSNFYQIVAVGTEWYIFTAAPA